jgi:phosphopantothenate-cysteine ligase
MDSLLKQILKKKISDKFIIILFGPSYMGDPYRIIITCGPASEPIDEVRSITNFSTGELGSLLSDHLAATHHPHSWQVLCLRGAGSTFPPPRHTKFLTFSTNADLEKHLQQLASHEVGAIFHLAALCDFYLARIENTQGLQITSSKLSSEYEELRLILAPAPKIIHRLRNWFPHSKIVGWKYELEGSPDHALTSGFEQIQTNKTDACVVNGRACGNHFTFLEKDGKNPVIISTKLELCEHLKNWLIARIGSSTEN